MKSLVFSDSSLADLEDLLRYISRDKPGAATRFVEKLENQCELLSQFPDLGQKREDIAKDLRLFTYRGYGIYYRHLVDRVCIERVLHPALDVRQQSFE